MSLNICVSKNYLMKKALIAFGMLLMTAGAVNAGGLVTKHASSVQLTVDALGLPRFRTGSSFNIRFKY